MTFVLPVDTYSPDQLSELMLELQDLTAAARNNSVRNKADDTPALSPSLEQLLANNATAANDPSSLEALAKEVQTTLESAPTAHLLLAATPPRSMKRQLVTWFRTEIHPLTLVTFAARSDLGGGAIVQIGSHLYDLSFRRLIIDNRARLTEIAGV